MEYKKTIEVLQQIYKEKQAKEVKQIKQIKKFIEYGYTSNKYELKNGEYLYFRKLTERQTKKPITEQKTILIKKYTESLQKELANKIKYIKELEQTEALEQIEITIEWTNGSAYGWQAKATAYAKTASGWEHYEGSKTGGCGYDKRSTASASVLNQINPLFVLIANKLEKLSKKQIKEYLTRSNGRGFIGYGFDFWGGAVGSFSGGVGFDCHRDNLVKLGFECATIHEGKQEDFYIFERKTKGVKKQ